MAETLPLFVAGQEVGTCQMSGTDPLLVTPVTDLLTAMGCVRGQGFIWNPAPPSLFIAVRYPAPLAVGAVACDVPVYVNGVRVASGSLDPEGRLILGTPLPRFLRCLGYVQGKDWTVRSDPPGIFLTPKRLL